MMTILMQVAGLLPVAWPEWLRKLLAVVGLIVAAFLLLLMIKVAYDASVIADHEAERAEQTIEARDEAADKRAADAIGQANDERERNEAIDAAPGGALSGPAHALACERLRKLGRIPAACRHQGGDGAEAGPQ